MLQARFQQVPPNDITDLCSVVVAQKQLGGGGGAGKYNSEMVFTVLDFYVSQMAYLQQMSKCSFTISANNAGQH